MSDICKVLPCYLTHSKYLIHSVIGGGGCRPAEIRSSGQCNLLTVKIEIIIIIVGKTDLAQVVCQT